MVLVDSSVLIPLAWSGNLDLLKQQFESVITVDEVYEEVVEDAKGKKGTSKLAEAFEDWIITKEFDFDEDIAVYEGISRTDAKLVFFAKERDEALITNDRAMVQVAETQNIETYWTTTLLIKAVREETLDSEEAKDILYELVQEGMNLDNKVYSKIIKKLDTM